MATQRLRRVYVVKADALGTGHIDVTPAGSVDWVITNTNVKNDGAANSVAEAQAFGGPNDTTSTGNGDTSDTRTVLHPADVMRVIWSGCTPGSTCTLAISGVQYDAYTAPWE